MKVQRMRLPLVLLFASLLAQQLLAQHVLADTLAIIPPPITLDENPYGMAISPDGGSVYVVNTNPSSSPRTPTISVINTSTNTVTGSPIVLATGYAEQIAITPDGTRLYVATSNRVDAVNLATLAITPIVTSGYFLNASDVVISADGTRAYVSNRTDDTVSIIDTNPASVTFNTIIGSIGVNGGNAFQPYALALNPDGSQLYVSSGPTRTVKMIDTATQSITSIGITGTGTGSSGVYSSGAVTSTDGKRLYVAFGSFIAVIDSDFTSATFNQQLGTIETGGGGLTRLAVTEDGTTLLATEGGTGGGLLVISLSSEAILQKLTIPNAGNLVYRGAPDGFAYVSSSGNPGSVTVVGASAAIPEPGTFLLLASGLGGLALKKRASRKSASG